MAFRGRRRLLVPSLPSASLFIVCFFSAESWSKFSENETRKGRATTREHWLSRRRTRYVDAYDKQD